MGYNLMKLESDSPLLYATLNLCEMSRHLLKRREKHLFI